SNNMFKSQITHIFRRYGSDKVSMGKNYKKVMEKFKITEEALLKKIGDDAELKQSLLKYEEAYNELNHADIEDVFKEGFILGARVVLEICGVGCEEE
ncbi:MAG: hypothetical protein K2H24_04775, partial [Clostridia bacterium]|nr:hypothetical protein [Clostridia bacterium]